MILTTAIIVLLALAVVLGYVATRPGSFRIERSIQISAMPEKVFVLINDFHLWPQWSPWEKLDPSMQRQHNGAASGPGAVYAWEGNPKVGSGRMEILSVTAPTKLVIQLDFFKPFKAHNTAEYSLLARDNGTFVTWAMYGPSPFMSKLMGLFFNMDKLVGKDFEAGLANMKAVAEA